MPFKSKAQMRAAFGGYLGKEMKNKADTWAHETSNIKKLPMHVSKHHEAMAKLHEKMAEHHHEIAKHGSGTKEGKKHSDGVHKKMESAAEKMFFGSHSR